MGEKFTSVSEDSNNLANLTYLKCIGGATNAPVGEWRMYWGSGKMVWDQISLQTGFKMCVLKHGSRRETLRSAFCRQSHKCLDSCEYSISSLPAFRKLLREHA
ncbi:hypothetical protein AX15_002896 [Amanita polypyramis BW_CC]|nr:hypothetical protein AX15_002896 [Amanita polypyramis BW_CC]